MENKREFECPQAIIIEFDDNEIIVTSGPGGEGPGQPTDDWHGWW